MGLNSPSKDIKLQTGLKKKTEQFVVYKKPTLQTETNKGLGWKEMAPENRQE
jgi:hypothetical protein